MAHAFMITGVAKLTAFKIFYRVIAFIGAERWFPPVSKMLMFSSTVEQGL